MVEAVVEYDYDAVNPDELNLKEGEIITNINMLEDGWWEGELNGKRGMFPDNFVKVIKEDKSKKNSKTRAAPAPPVNGDAHISQESTEPVAKRESASAKRKFRAKVAFSYHPENDDELDLEVDDIIEVVGQPEDGWWEGMVRGNKGVFPSNFVTVLEGDENMDAATNGKGEDKVDSLGDNETKVMPRASIRRNRHLGIKAKQQEPPPVKPLRPLSIRQGSAERRVSEPKEDLPKDEEAPAQKQPKPIGGKPVGGVGFGNIFAGGSVHLRKTSQEQGKGAKKAEPPKRPELSDLAQKRQSLRKPLAPPDDPKKEKKEVKEIKAEKKEEPKEEMAPEEEIVGKSVIKPPVKTSDAPVVEKAKVNFDYDAQNPDELSLKEGDVIVITSKEAGDSGWWEGEINGRKGVFPDNFVTLLPPERIKRKIAAPVPARPNAAPKNNDEVKPITASKPRKGPPAKPPATEEQPSREETQPKPPPPGGKQVFPMVPPKKPNFNKKLPPKPQDKDVPKRPPSFVDKDHNKDKPPPEKKESPVETKDSPDVTFDDIKPSTEKLKHVNLSRPRNANKRPPSVFGVVPGLANEGASKHVPTSPPSTDQKQPPPSARNAPLHKSFPPPTHSNSSTNANPPSPSAQPPWAKELKRTTVRKPSPIAPSSDNIQDSGDYVGLRRTSALKPAENDATSSAPTRPATTPSPVSTALNPSPLSNKPEVNPATSPGNDQPADNNMEQQHNAASAAMLESMDEMKKQMKTMQEDMSKQLVNMKAEFKKELKKLMVEVDEEKILRLSMQVELERIKKLVLES